MIAHYENGEIKYRKLEELSVEELIELDKKIIKTSEGLENEI